MHCAVIDRQQIRVDSLLVQSANKSNCLLNRGQHFFSGFRVNSADLSHLNFHGKFPFTHQLLKIVRQLGSDLDIVFQLLINRQTRLAIKKIGSIQSKGCVSGVHSIPDHIFGKLNRFPSIFLDRHMIRMQSITVFRKALLCSCLINHVGKLPGSHAAVSLMVIDYHLRKGNFK